MFQLYSLQCQLGFVVLSAVDIEGNNEISILLYFFYSSFYEFVDLSALWIYFF